MINRREAIRCVSALLGGMAFVGGSNLLAAAEKPRPEVNGAVGDFTLQDIELLDEIADTILPATKTPGAKAAKTGAFMALMVTDCYGPEDQKTFRAGLRSLASFAAATPSQRLALLTALDREQHRVMDGREGEQPAHYFGMMKQLAVLGYFTSEIGCTQAQRYVESPGRFDPCIPYTPGESAWALHA
ncbi:MAG TPA: gluconate 2-dehydrogenase subunit 3 family protein [Steroidobacteraceae bacterium]|jgi:hypothetical protein|nr:gluconate 2-dehydrogenase subunit 3 family protein [Steroidobacteraceae bacterium]